VTRAEIDNALAQARKDREIALNEMRDWLTVTMCDAAIRRYTRMQEDAR